MSVVTRFAPSPTGLMHIGNCRTALFSYLWARHAALNGDADAKFILRLEDTDKERSKPEYAAQLCQDLHMLGIRWDVGPSADAAAEQARTKDIKEKYTQSLRTHIYEEYYEQLTAKGLAYPCFCSEATLKLARKRQLAAGEPPRYSGTCRSLSRAEIDAKLAAGEKPALRFRVADDAVIEFHDKVKGRQRFLGKHIGDFVIRKSGGEASFMFANAVDDALMGVTLVVRGEDHLSNSPNQLMILRALKLPLPDYAHISLITGSDGAPLSKRNGSKSIQELLNREKRATEESYLPKALVNYLARLGGSYDSEELLSMEELAKQFNPAALTKSAARYDEAQLKHWQGRAMAALLRAGKEEIRQELEPIVELASKELSSADGKISWQELVDVTKDNVVFPKDLLDWAKLLGGKWDAAELDFAKVEADKELYLQASQAVEVKASTDLKQSWGMIAAQISANTERRGKRLFKPLRLALSGVDYGPPLEDIFALLGKETAIKRFRNAYNKIND